MTQSTLETKRHALPPTRARRIVWSVVCACVVFGGFLAYAFLAATIYQTSAEVRLEIPAGLENSLHPIADRKARLTKAVLGPDALKQLSQELQLTKPDERLELAHQLSSGVSITTDDGQVFRIVCTNADASRAQRLCQGLARMSAARLPEAAMLRDSPEEQARRDKLERLLEYLTQHPELSSAKGQNAAEPAKDDALLAALTQQRRVVVAELNELQRVDPNNPYAAGLKQEVDQAHKRLAAIDVALATRRKGLEATKQNAGPELDSKVMASLTEQLNQLAERETKSVPREALKASVSKQPPLPSSPIVPDRTRLLILGALASLGVAILGLGFAFAANGRPEPVRPASAAPDPALAPAATAHEWVVTPVPVHGAQGGAQGGVVQGAAHAATPQVGLDDAAQGHAAQGSLAATPSFAPVQALPAKVVSVEDDDWPNPGNEVVEPQRPVKLTTTQALDEPAPRPQAAPPTEPRAEPQPVPRTQLGGFELAPAVAPGEKPTEPQQEKPSRSDQPISARTVVALEANIDAEEEPIEKEPQTLLGGMLAPSEPPPASPSAPPPASPSAPPPVSRSVPPPAPAKAAYTPPKRNITRRLGSLSWADQAELSRSPTQPVSTRYSYVSSRPPPPEAAAAGGPARAPDVIDVPAEGDEASTALSVPLPARSLTRRHPVPNGWTLPPELVPFSTPELATTVSEGWRAGCIIVGVTSRYDLSRIKSSVAASLAFRLGEFVPRVLLMEGDFQDPKVHRIARVEMPISGGLSQQLQLRLARGSSPDLAWEVMECHSTVDVLAEGVIRSPGGILSQQFEECLNDLRTCYDLVIMDGPPTGTGSEAQAFADLVDGVVVCTPRDRPDVQGLADSLFRNQRFIVPYPLNV